MKPTIHLTAALLIGLCTACNSPSTQGRTKLTKDKQTQTSVGHEDEDEDEDTDGEVEETEIPLASVPQAVIDAAKAAVPGIKFEEAATEQEDGQLIYCLEGEVAGQEYEIEVSASGKVLEIEKGEEEHDD